MKIQKLGVLFCLLAGILLTLTACLDSTSQPSTSEGKTETENSADLGENVVNIGFSGPLSGSAAYYGEKILNGMELAIEEINQEGFEVNGKTYKLNLVALDDKYLPNETAANAKRLVEQYHTPIIFTPHSGGVYALQVFNEQDKFLIGAYTSEPSVTEKGNSLTIRIPPSYHGYLEPFTTYAMEKFGTKLAAIPPVTQYGQDWAKALIPFWEEKGGEVVYESSVDFAKDTDFFTILTNALKKNPDVLFIGGPSEPTAKVAKQARELGFKGGFIVMDQAKLDEMQRLTGSYEFLEGSIGTMPIIYADYPGVAEFVDKYRKKYGKDPGSESGYHYLTMYVLVEAMKAAENVEDAEAIRKHIQDGLDAIPEEKKVYVIPRVDENGAFKTNVRVGAVENGEIIGIKVN
ncbi:ABC transporter substrate-binding protein [Calidifontibacillus erzurumensis]|uniref:ABC transporter substrate-binding protein n=1 Tax=Calidifontibacillus erzurumensis TaxID=2741433 RepID=A0A8J8GH44_9BACI|nr:ABC transporter substrate-binding protein [Calidifontibacillus erzurumensis]NSL51676.1 ABC transporter substrate-binding protein [Calidifontibacillus erzurumensis]